MEMLKILFESFGQTRAQERGYRDYFEHCVFNSQLAFLTTLESHYGIDLSKSKSLPPQNVLEIDRLIQRYNTWIEKKCRLKYDGVYAVLTENDHRRLGLAIDQENGNRLLERFFGAARSDLTVIMGESDTPAGRNHSFCETNGHFVHSIVITHFNPDSRNPNAAYPVEARVAEEMLHGVSSMSVLEPYLQLTPDKVYVAEEIGVKYYVDQILQENGFRQARRTFRSLGHDEEYIGIWKEFTKRVGATQSDWLFFFGYGGSSTTAEDWRVFETCINDAVAKRNSN